MNETKTNLEMDSKQYWSSYYKTHQNPTNASPFAEWISSGLLASKTMLELGCGNGRDAVFFANTHPELEVCAIDQCQDEIAYLNKNYSQENLVFECADFSKLGTVPRVDYIYSRFTLHAISKAQEQRVLDWSQEVLNSKGRFFIEVRANEGNAEDIYAKGQKILEEDDAYVTDHYRRFCDFTFLKQELLERDFKLVYAEKSRGFAPYKDEDPVVIRIIAEKV